MAYTYDDVDLKHVSERVKVASRSLLEETEKSLYAIDRNLNDIESLIRQLRDKISGSQASTGGAPCPPDTPKPPATLTGLLDKADYLSGRTAQLCEFLQEQVTTL